MSGFYAYLVARGDTSVVTNPVPRGLQTRRAGGRARTVPLVRVPRTLPRVLSPGEVDALLGALRTARDRAMVLAMLLGGLRRCEVLGLRLGDIRVADRAVFVVDGKGGHQRLVPIANAFFTAVGDYLRDERPPDVDTDRVFVVLKRPRRGRPLTIEGLDEIIAGARQRAGLERGTCHQLRHTCLTRLREAGMALEAVQAQAGHRSIESTRIYLHLTNDWLADQYRRAVRPHRRGHRRAHRPPGGDVMTAAHALVESWNPSDISHREWAELSTRAPQLAATMRRYLVQLATILAPRSVEVADSTLRQLARWLADSTEVTAVADITRSHFEDYKVWLAARPGTHGATLSKNTQRQRLRMIRIFFERLIDWDWPDAPRRNPILHGDIPPRPEPLPKFLDDRDAARLMAAARTHPDPRTRLVVEMLARTGLRAGELCDLAADAVTQIGDAHWLRVPVGKLRNDRYIPLHPDLVVLLAEWTATHADHIRAQRRLIADHRAPLEGRTVHRIVGRVAKRAGIGHVHPHQLRHTLATQAINRGMRLEAIAALLGHRSMEMTLTYARIADRVVADEYASVHAHIDALYGQIPTGALPADVETAAMTRLRHEAHARMLGNGLCTRPGRARLPHGDRLRNLRLLRHRTRVHPRPPPPTRPRPRPPPARPRRPLRHPHPTCRNILLTAITRITPVRGRTLRSAHPV